jgi:hypothetical protein
MHFREEPVTPVYRHWMCEQVGCNGELLSTGESITRLSTSWKHRCGKCGHEDWADATYPRVAYLPIDAIGPDDSILEARPFSVLLRTLLYRESYREA